MIQYLFFRGRYYHPEPIKFSHTISGINLILSRNIKNQNQKQGWGGWGEKADNRNRLTENQILELSEIAIYLHNDNIFENKRTATYKKNQTYARTEKTQ